MYRFDDERFFRGLSIDYIDSEKAQVPLSDVYRSIDDARKNQTVLVLYGHAISDTPSFMKTPTDRLIKIIEYTLSKGLNFFRVKDLHRPDK